MKSHEPLSSLRRTDKWYLAGGNRLLYAPTFPLFGEAPGFWDKAHYYNYSFGPLYSWGILASDGHDLDLHLTRSVWQPDCLIRTFVPRDRSNKLVITERSSLLPTDVIVSEVTLRNTSQRASSWLFVTWTARDHDATRSFSEPSSEENVFSCAQTVSPPGRAPLTFGFAFSLAGAGVHHDVRRSEASVPLPRWSMTPFGELKRLRKSDPSSRWSDDGSKDSLYAGFQSRIRLASRSVRTLRLGCAAAQTQIEARANLAGMLRRKTPTTLSTVAWNDHFLQVPQVHCSDPFIEQAYQYRWYGLKLNTIVNGEKNYEYPFTCEGIGYFRAPISFSAPCHIFENRWMADPELARGSLLTFIHNQRDDGAFRGYIDVNSSREEMFYHANWGRALLALEASHPSGNFLSTAYEALKRYAAYFDRERDEEVSGLYDIHNHYETGQEFMRRYMVIAPEADRDHWGKVFRLKGVDVSVYIYELKQALALSAERLGLPDEAELWSLEATRTRQAILRLMWDADEEMFFDVDPATGKRTGVKAVTCFYPYFTDVVEKKHLSGLKKHLSSRTEFWAPWPVPATSMDDPSFCAEPLWKGQRKNCPWNGRVWPMTNSHIMEALGTCALRFDDGRLENMAAEFLTKFIRMLFHDQDPHRPNCFEHYNPLTGAPSLYRGIDDYMHSWVNDLILKYVFGIHPGLHTVTIRPLRMGLRKASVHNVRIHGRILEVELRENRFSVTIDEGKRVHARMGERVELQV